jgi:ABC-2 type transport system ATP-binding protein
VPASAAAVPAPAPVVAASAAEAAPVAAPASAVSAVVTTATSPIGDLLTTLSDLLPTDSPLSWALLAAARRQPPAAQVTASSIFDNNITVNPAVVWGGTLKAPYGPVELPGVLTGAVNAVSSADLPMTYVVLRRPDAGGKIGGGPLLPLTNFYGPEGGFTYLPYSTTLTDSAKNEQFKIMAMELSKVDQFFAQLLGPAGNLVVTQVVAGLHRIPLVGDLLSPIIGQAKTVTFDVNPNTLAAERPTAFTYKVPSFDGTLISVNYFPASNVAKGLVDEAPTVLAASGLACAANTDPTTRFGQLFPSNQFGSLTPGIAPLRDDYFKSTLPGGLEYNGGGGYNVLTWDPRGEFASGGQLQIDNPMFEGRDVSSIISWLTDSTNPAAKQVKTAAGDPLIGMTGGSYGGGIQLTTVDPRIDAITPEIGWNSLLSSLNPDGVFKTGWGSILAAALAFTGARINPAIYQGIFTGALFGFLSPSSQAVLASVGPTTLLTKEQAPTMLFQGIHDTLFPLNQSVANGQTIQTSPADPALKLFWFCGGHGDCDIPSKPLEQDQYGLIQNLMWMDQYVAKSGTPATDKIKTFQWFDQKGLYYNSDLLPWDPSFNEGSYTVPTAEGGFLGIWPILGGSGPAPIKDLPFSIVNAGEARNAVNVIVTPPAGKQIVGAPEIGFTYSGFGTASAVYAQLVDQESGLVLSNIATPIPVTLDGRTHTVTMDMEDIAYTAEPGASLTLQITSSAINYEKFWSFGWVNIADIGLTLPQHTTAAPVPFVP